jgi:hypothetical protein
MSRKLWCGLNMIRMAPVARWPRLCCTLYQHKRDRKPKLATYCGRSGVISAPFFGNKAPVVKWQEVWPGNSRVGIICFCPWGGRWLDCHTGFLYHRPAKHADNITFTPWSTVLEKLMVIQLLKKFLAFYGIRRLITVSPSSVEPHESTLLLQDVFFYYSPIHALVFQVARSLRGFLLKFIYHRSRACYTVRPAYHILISNFAIFSKNLVAMSIWWLSLLFGDETRQHVSSLRSLLDQPP